MCEAGDDEGGGVVEIFGYIAICNCDKSAKNREKNEWEREEISNKHIKSELQRARWVWLCVCVCVYTLCVCVFIWKLNFKQDDWIFY